MTPVVVDPTAAATGATDWDALTAAVRGCVACPELVASRTQVVPGVRPRGARLLLVGEAPGAQEDASGLPFVGRAGQLLDVLLAEAGLPRERVAVANVLKCRPPGNRAPSRAEVERCRPWLRRQLDLVDPVLVVTLGGTAAGWVFGRGTRLGELRGSVHRPPATGGRATLVTYHPSAALRFGPRGDPRTALAEDLVEAARLVGSAGAQ